MFINYWTKRFLRETEEKLQRDVEASLPDLVARLPDQALSLTQEQWTLLYYLLYKRRRSPSGDDEEAASVLVVLQALRKYAYQLALPHPEFLTETVASLWAKAGGSISEAAEACLPALQAKLRGAPSSSRVA